MPTKEPNSEVSAEAKTKVRTKVPIGKILIAEPIEHTHCRDTYRCVLIIFLSKNNLLLFFEALVNCEPAELEWN